MRRAVALALILAAYIVLDAMRAISTFQDPSHWQEVRDD